MNGSAPSTTSLADPLASGSARFPLGRPSDEPPEVDAPSPIGLRPWGLRRLGPVFGTTGAWSAWRYDHERQIAVDGSGRAMLDIVDGPPTAPTTPPTDGEDPPSGEDWRNDYTPDYPVQP